MYEGPVIDAFFHLGWTNNGPDAPTDRETWMNDPMRSRVMRTFGQAGMESRTSEESIGDTIGLMEDAGVELAVLQAGLFYSGSADDVEAAVAKHHHVVSTTDKFTHIGTILPPRQGPASYWDLLENPRLIAAHKDRFDIRGIHIMPSPWGTPPNDKWFYPLYAKCVELDLCVFSYVGMPGPLWPTYPNYPLHLDDVCIAFPELRVVAHHIGDPWVEMMTHLAAKHRNLYICTSAWSPRRYPSELVKFMAGRWHGQAGADKVIFGSDHPLLHMTKTVRDARNLDLPEAVVEKFMYSNIKALLAR
ncbi:amidohydrolase family protein [Dactylosporangium sp. CA-092794]|uniref:amidohydrolase family protein n=1 Tax=Dactylosporangium sp. CA-092794 TaxID=3239929 RepID=UPI003D940244